MTLPAGVTPRNDQVTRWGVVVALYPQDTEFAMEIQRAPDDGSGNPDVGSAVTIETVGPNGTGYLDQRPAQSGPWHYRARHVRSNYTAGTWSEWVSARPRPIPTVLPDRNPRPRIDASILVDQLSGLLSVFFRGERPAQSIKWAVTTTGSWPDLDSTGTYANLTAGVYESVDFTTLAVNGEARLDVRFYDGLGGAGNVVGTVRDITNRTVPVDCAPVLDEDNGAWYITANKLPGVGAVYYTYTVDGSTPADPKGASEGGGPVGTLSTATEIGPIVTTTVDGTLVRVKVKAVVDAAGTGAVGPVHALRGTFLEGDQGPDVTWRKGVPSGADPAGIEAVELLCTDDGSTVALYYRTYLEGAGPPAYTRLPVTPGTYSPDPLTQLVEVTRPAEGGTPVIIEFKGEDNHGQQSDPLKLRVDGDVIPSGLFDSDMDDQTGVVTVTPSSTDPDSGSWRFKVNRTALGTNTFVDPAFSDIATDEFKGNTFGAAQVLSAAAQKLTKGQQLNISGYFFRTTSTTAANQSASTRSPLVRVIVKKGSETENNIRVMGYAYLPAIDGAGRACLQLQLQVKTGTLVQSMHVRVRWTRNPSGGGHILNDLAYNFNVSAGDFAHFVRVGTTPGPALDPTDIQVFYADDTDTTSGVLIDLDAYDAANGSAGAGNLGDTRVGSYRPENADSTGAVGIRVDNTAGGTLPVFGDKLKLDSAWARAFADSDGRPKLRFQDDSAIDQKVKVKGGSAGGHYVYMTSASQSPSGSQGLRINRDQDIGAQCMGISFMQNNAEIWQLGLDATTSSADPQDPDFTLYLAGIGDMMRVDRSGRWNIGYFVPSPGISSIINIPNAATCPHACMLHFEQVDVGGSSVSHIMKALGAGGSPTYFGVSVDGRIGAGCDYHSSYWLACNSYGYVRLAIGGDGSMPADGTLVEETGFLFIQSGDVKLRHKDGSGTLKTANLGTLV